MVNNAGIADPVPFASNDEDKWTKLVDINLTAVIRGTRIAIQEFKALEKPGCIINTASDAGLKPISVQPVYASVKAGVVNFTRSLAHLSKEGIRVNTICPGLVRTSINTKFHALDSVMGERWSEISTVIDAFMMAITDETIAGIFLF